MNNLIIDLYRIFRVTWRSDWYDTVIFTRLVPLSPFPACVNYERNKTAIVDSDGYSCGGSGEGSYEHRRTRCRKTSFPSVLFSCKTFSDGYTYCMEYDVISLIFIITFTLRTSAGLVEKNPIIRTNSEPKYWFRSIRGQHWMRVHRLGGCRFCKLLFQFLNDFNTWRDWTINKKKSSKFTQ